MFRVEPRAPGGQGLTALGAVPYTEGPPLARGGQELEPAERDVVAGLLRMPPAVQTSHAEVPQVQARRGRETSNRELARVPRANDVLARQPQGRRG